MKGRLCCHAAPPGLLSHDGSSHYLRPHLTAPVTEARIVPIPGIGGAVRAAGGGADGTEAHGAACSAGLCY